MYRVIDISHETIRNWCYKFDNKFLDIIKKGKAKLHINEI